MNNDKDLFLTSVLLIGFIAIVLFGAALLSV